MKILLVTTSHQQPDLKGLGLDSLAAPYYAFLEAGADILIATPKGGPTPIDTNCARSTTTNRFLADQDAVYLLENALKLSETNAADFDAIFITGGRGAMWDLVDNKDLNHLLQDFNRARKPIAAVGHGVAGLSSFRDKDGVAVLAGRNITAISNAEETTAVPFPLETRLNEIGAVYFKGNHPHVVSDDNIITGQNSASAVGTAEALIEQLENNYYVHFKF